MPIEFYTKHVYGVAREYVADEQINRIVSTLTKEKTLNSKQKWALTALGCTFVEVLPPKDYSPVHA